MLVYSVSIIRTKAVEKKKTSKAINRKSIIEELLMTDETSNLVYLSMHKIIVVPRHQKKRDSKIMTTRCQVKHHLGQ